MTQEPSVENNEAVKNVADESSEETPVMTKDEAALLALELRKRELIERLEEEARETPLGRLCRSREFWFMVFGVIFVLIMGFLIAWVARDLGYIK